MFNGTRIQFQKRITFFGFLYEQNPAEKLGRNIPELIFSDVLLSFYLFNYKLGEKLVRIVWRLDLLDRRSWGPHLRNSQLEKSGAYLGPAR